MRIARPLYESLPYVYMLTGIAAIATSFLWREPGWSEMTAVLGLLLVVAGLMLALRRRDYRIQHGHYGSEFEDDE